MPHGFLKSFGHWRWRAVAGAVLVLLASPAWAVQVTLELVVADQPATTVDKMEASRVITDPVSTERGMVMEKIGLDLTCWARHVQLDGQAVFERYHEGKYIDRLPIARAELKVGKHVLWPGNHTFEVGKDNALTTADPELIIAGATVKMKMYPVTVRAYRANPEESDLPMSMRTAALPNLTVRESANARESAPKTPGGKDTSLELLPVFDRFAPLTIYLPANTVGNGYLIHPVGLTFHVTPQGVVPGAGGADAGSVPGLRVEKSKIEIPLYGFPITGGAGTTAVIAGVEKFDWSANAAGQRKLTNWYPRRQAYEVKIADHAPALTIDGDVSKLPIKALHVDAGEAGGGTPRAIAIETATRELTVGAMFSAKVQAVDAAAGGRANRALVAARKAMGAAEAALKDAKGQTPVDAVRVQAAEKALAEAKADVEAKLTATEGAGAENVLAAAPVFARLAPYGSDTWTELTVTGGQGTQIQAKVPALADGAYRLRVGVRTGDAEATELFEDVWVSLAADRPVSLGIFTQRGRDVFRRGEAFYLALGVMALKAELAANTAVTVDLVDAANTTIPLFRGQTARVIAAGKSDTLTLNLSGQLSLSLAPGKYRAIAKVAGVSSREFPLEIVEPDPRTHFSNLFNGKYSSLGPAYGRAISTGTGSDKIAREIAERGCNGFSGMTYDMNRIHRFGMELEQLVRDRASLGPWESYYQPSGRDRFLGEMVRHNIRFYEDLFTQHDAMLPRGQRILDACQRYAALETASMRFSPGFYGVCLYDELYDSGDNDAPPWVIPAFLKSQEMSYREKNGGATSADAAKALDRFTSRPVGQRRFEDLQRYRSWAAHQDGDWREFSDRMASVTKQIAPWSQNWTQFRAWGHNGASLAVNGCAPDVFASLDVAVCVMYKDGGSGDRPVFAPMMADILRVRDNIPVWTQLHSNHAPSVFGDHVLRQAFYGLSQKVEGFSFFTEEDRENLQNIAGKLTTPYGDLFVASQKGYKQVAIVYSRESAWVSSRKPNNLAMQCEGLWVACSRAGFPADFLYDDQVRAGKAMDYQVVFVPGIAYEDEVSPDLLAQLRRLVDAGKTVIVERSSKLPLERIVRLDSELDEFDQKIGGAFPRYEDYEFTMVFEQSKEMTKLLRETLPKYCPPAAEHNLLVGPDWLRCRQGQYMILPNFAPVGFTGLSKTLYQAPDAPTLRFPKRPPFCYDVLENKAIEAKTDGDWMTVRADMRDYPGKILAFLPAAISRVSIGCLPRLAAGTDLTYEIAVQDATGTTIDAGFPLQITLTDPSGKTLYEVFRAGTPTYRAAYRIPVNIAPGTWKLRVKELIAGTVAEASFDVTSGTAGQASLDTNAVRLHDAAQVRAFLAAKGPVVIALDDEQPWVRPHAERLAKALVAAGRDAKIVAVSAVTHLAGSFDGKPPTFDGTRMWRGEVVEPGIFVDSSLILLGKRYENRLIEALIRRDALVEPVSANFPGPGRALVDWTPRGFSSQFDTISILSFDDAGLAQGIDAFLASSSAAETPVHAALVTPEPDAKAQLVAVTGARSEPQSITSVLANRERFRTIDVDAATGRVLVSTRGYAENLFCFAADGKLIWKTYLPEQNVYFAKFYDGGSRIVAATARGFFAFLMDASNGKVLKKFATTEWQDGHGYGGFWEGAHDTEVRIRINTALRQILIQGRSGLLAVSFEGQKMWFFDRAATIAAYPKEAEQGLAAAFGHNLHLGDFAVSPDGSKIVWSEEIIAGSTPDPDHRGAPTPFWRQIPKILDARTGKVELENSDDPGLFRQAGNWGAYWNADSPRPYVWCGGGVNMSAPILENGHVGALAPVKPELLRDGLTLDKTASSITRRDASGAVRVIAKSERSFVPSLDALAPDHSRLYRQTVEGLVTCINLADGKSTWTFQLPFQAMLQATGDGVFAGCNSGELIKLDLAGKRVWSANVRNLKELPASDYPAYVVAGLRRDIDSTPDYLPVYIDAPGDYDKILRMGIEQLVNTDFEAAEGWTLAGGKPTIAAPAFSGKAALQLVPGQLVTQRLQRRIVPSATYLLEFYYQVDGEQTKVIAGANVSNGKSESLTASKFAVQKGQVGKWLFGRLAIKSLTDTATIDVGFETEGGAARVDHVSLRPIRFPSPNLLAVSELAALEPTFVSDYRFQYDRIPRSLADKLRTRNHVVGFRTGEANTSIIWAQEQAYLQNGRLDDIGSMWSYQPDNMGFSVVLAKPSWVSHIVLYLNDAEPENVYRTLSILCNDLKTKLPADIALVRGNTRRFVVIHFPEPVYTDVLKILSGYHQAHQECMTEIEVYGPLGGPEVAGSAKSFTADADAFPMFMANPAHVPGTLPTDAVGAFAEISNAGNDSPAYLVGSTVADGLVTFGQAHGAIQALKLSKADAKEQRLDYANRWGLSSVTPTSTPARFAGRLLVGSADQRVHAIGDDGTPLWQFATGGRVYSSPTPTGDDVFVGSDDGKLYKLDVDSGTLIWEFSTGDKVRSAPALGENRVFAASFDGFLYAVDAQTGLPLWKAAIASQTRASAAVDKDRVYLADEAGVVHCWDAATGKAVWKSEPKVEGYVSMCPVVTDEGVFVASEQGEMMLVGRDGAAKWSRKLGARVTGQPIATETQVLVPTANGLMVIKRADGQVDERYKGPGAGQVTGVLKYGENLLVSEAGVGVANVNNRTFVSYGSSVRLWRVSDGTVTTQPARKPRPNRGGK